jgi:hypothetical protein
MASPFPGMDPFIESQQWSDFHATIVPLFREMIAPALGERYVCTVEKYVYLLAEDDSITRQVSPDVNVIEELQTFERSAPRSIGSQSVATLEPQVLKLSAPPQTELKYLMIRDREGGEIITVIELLSPVNKSRGEGQQEYLRKRTEFVRSPAHIVEIDLLRGGVRLPFDDPLPPADFLASVARSERRPDADVYSWQLRDPLPTIPIPLRADDGDVPLDLQAAFTRVYDAAQYFKLLKYDRPVLPRLSADDEQWVQTCIRQWRSARQ